MFACARKYPSRITGSGASPTHHHRQEPIHPRPRNPKPYILNPKTETLNPKPQTLNTYGRLWTLGRIASAKHIFQHNLFYRFGSTITHII